MAAINRSDVFTHVPTEIMQQILTDAQVSPRVALVCKRWREEIRDMTSRTFSYILKVEQKNLTDEQIQSAKDLFIKAVKDHRHFYSTWVPVIFSEFPLFSLERYNVIEAEVEPVKKAEAKIVFWELLPWGKNHIRDRRARIQGISKIDLAKGLSEWIQSTPTVQGKGRLYLDYANLRALPKEIENFTALQYLRIQGNRLTELPAEIGKLTALKELDLSSNQLIKIPAEIGELTSLYSLNLMSNQLTGLPVEIKSLTKLNHLLLSGNPLKSLHSSLVLRSSILGFATETTSEKWALNVMKYNKLSVEKQKNVHEWIWYEAGKPPGDDDYGQRHLFDDLEKFHKAMQAQATCNLL